MRGRLIPKEWVAGTNVDIITLVGAKQGLKLLGIFSSLFPAHTSNPGFLPRENKTKKQTTQKCICVMLHSEGHLSPGKSSPGKQLLAVEIPKETLVWGGGYSCFPLNSWMLFFP